MKVCAGIVAPSLYPRANGICAMHTNGAEGRICLWLLQPWLTSFLRF